MGIDSLPALFGVGDVRGISELAGGHINRTFLVTSGSGRYILQSLNRAVFRSPEIVMANISAVEAAFARCSDVGVPHYLSCGGRNYTVQDGELWRMYGYCEGAACEERLYRVGYAYGAFIRVMNGSGAEIKPAIDGFHDLERYYRRLEEVCPCGAVHARLAEVRERLGGCFAEAPMRIVHGDAKADNIVIGERCTILDLDTVMIGYTALDYGDMVRSVCAGGTDTESMREVTRGFMDGLGGTMSESEQSTLFCGVLWAVGELAMRYLTDYYSEERYFRGKTRRQCLERSQELIDQLGRFIEEEKELTALITG